MDKKDAYLWLKSIDKISNSIIDKILQNGLKVEDILNLSDKEIYEMENINLNIKENIVKYKSLAYLDDIKEKLRHRDIKYVSIEDNHYPSKLKNIYNAPKLLYYKGNINLLNEGLSIAMVGSRKATAYGKHCATTISSKLSEMNINVVSGLATGIDSYSHMGCIKGGGKTVAVIGSSMDNILPRKNLYLSKEILENDGLIISEYGIDSKVYPSNYVHRNRIISGISDGVIVVEAAIKSGALITADFALEQGREVFSIPGSIHSAMSEGCHKIIKEGAKLVCSIEDILEEYKIINNKNKENFKKYDNINLDKKSRIIIDTIKNKGTLHIDEICDNTRMDIKYVNIILNELVLRDILVQINNNRYILNS